MVYYLLHLDTETQNRHLYMSEKRQNGSQSTTVHMGEYILFKKNDSETERAGAETPRKFKLKCQGFYTDGDLNWPLSCEGIVENGI